MTNEDARHIKQDNVVNVNTISVQCRGELVASCANMFIAISMAHTITYACEKTAFRIRVSSITSMVSISSNRARVREPFRHTAPSSSAPICVICGQFPSATRWANDQEGIARQPHDPVRPVRHVHGGCSSNGIEIMPLTPPETSARIWFRTMVFPAVYDTARETLSLIFEPGVRYLL